MAPPGRNGIGARSSIRAPTRTASRQGYTRQGSVAPRIDRAGATSPAESLMSVATSATAGLKRKERDFDADEGEATNITVVVRCRGRNGREVKENSAVVLRTEGAMGKMVELSMGPSALSNKAYNFDRVFSQAADQAMVFDDVVKPILDEVNLRKEGAWRQTADLCRCSRVSTAQSLPTARQVPAKHTRCRVI
jgi:kinesin family member 11